MNIKSNDIKSNDIKSNDKLTPRAAQISSHWFLLLACCLVYCNYSTQIVICQIGQYILTMVVWSPRISSKTLIWSDRSLAVYNAYILGHAHHEKGVSYSYMLSLFSLVFYFKLLDWHITKAKTDIVSIWYLYWHFSLFILNVHLLTITDTN